MGPFTDCLRQVYDRKKKKVRVYYQNGSLFFVRKCKMHITASLPSTFLSSDISTRYAMAEKEVPDLLRAFSSVLTSASDFLVLVGTE
jgi:hypothetical protein